MHPRASLVTMILVLAVGAGPARADGGDDAAAVPASGPASEHGPHPTAFAERCDQLRRGITDDAVVRCARVHTARLGGHPVEVHDAITTRDRSSSGDGGFGGDGEIHDVFVAIDGQAGWFLSDPIEMGIGDDDSMGRVQRVGHLEPIDVRRAGRWLVVVVQARWNAHCGACEPNDYVARALGLVICGLRRSGEPSCTAPRQFRARGSRFPRVQIRGDRVVVAGAYDGGTFPIELP
jgi:hypothetical protein